MGDSLKDRLSNHSNSFEGLLSLIPARYYYDDETSSQWKKGSISIEEKKAAAHKARMDKFDPDVGSSALDEVKRREQLAANEETDGDSADDEPNVIIYDDSGNVIGDEGHESVNDLLRSKANNTEENASVSKPQLSKKKSVGKRSKLPIGKADQKPATNAFPFGQDNTSASKNAVSEVIATQLGTEELPDLTSENIENNSQPLKKPREGLEQLRARLTARVNELKAKRKAPGSDAKGAYKTREELLSARKAKMELRKNQALYRDKNRKDENNTEADFDADMLVEDEITDTKLLDKDMDSNLMFGQVQFGDGARLGKDSKSLEEERKHKKRNVIDQLRVLENRKSKIHKLDKTKQDEIAENAKWSRAILHTEGARVRDDESLLRKTIRQKENRKKRSEKEWKQRIYNVKKGVSDREAKRHANINAHKEAKKLRLKGKKRRQHMKAATK